LEKKAVTSSSSLAIRRTSASVMVGMATIRAVTYLQAHARAGMGWKVDGEVAVGEGGHGGREGRQ
jgi:hypothetical protein